MFVFWNFGLGCRNLRGVRFFYSLGFRIMVKGSGLRGLRFRV